MASTTLEEPSVNFPKIGRLPTTAPPLLRARGPDDSVGSLAYGASAVGLTAVFGCAFILLCCYIKSGAQKLKYDLAAERPSIGKVAANIVRPNLRQVHPTSTSIGVDERSANTYVVVSSPKLEADPLHRLDKRSSLPNFTTETKSPSHVVRSRTANVGVYDIDFSKGLDIDNGDAVGSWVGSPGWAAARASRRSRLDNFAPLGFRKVRSSPNLSNISGANSSHDIDDHHVHRQDVKVASNDHDVQEQSKESTFGALPSSKHAVSEQLQSTLHEDIALRRKTFKFLCAKWHPDKHVLGNVELATLVFQHLQEQKSWYLGE